MSNPSLVSVIIIFLNAKSFLRESIESVLAQTYQHWELLLVDDGSNDGSSELAKKYALQDPLRIHYFEHEQHENRGMSESRNLGIRNGRGDYIAFLDADDYWVPARLAIHVGILDSFPQVGMLYGSAKYWFSWTGRPEDQERDFVPRLRTYKPTLFDPPHLLSLLLEGKAEVPCTCSILVRRPIMNAVGGFEDSFPAMYEDQVFYAKICLATPVLATGDCLAWYRQHVDSNSWAAVSAGQVHALHFEFLNWLRRYCDEKQLQDPDVRRTIHRQLWLYDDWPRQRLPGISRERLRQVKKWLLRLEKRFVPSNISSRLWLHN